MHEDRKARLLVVDDHVSLLEALREYLEGCGFEVHTAESGERALELLEQVEVDMGFVDVVMPGMSGMELLDRMRAERDVPVVMMTGFAEVGTALEAIRRGAYEFLTKPVTPEMLPVLVENALDHHRLVRERKSREEPITSLGSLVGRSRPMLEVYQAIRDVADSDAAVLLIGETGTGKTLVAREIHAHSARTRGPFVHVNCNALSPGLFEAELFGHERGAFTGAEARRAGCFERAQGGTLLLDEVCSLPVELQGKLLRILEEKEYERVGGTETLSADVRIMAATNRDIRAMVQRGEFRSDLFFRLCTIPVHLTPLRERQEDIPLLVTRFLTDLAVRTGRDIPGLSQEALAEAQGHEWPGNVRELANAVEHAVVRGRGEVLRSVLPPEDVQIAPGAGSPRRDPRESSAANEVVAETAGRLAHLTFQEASTQFQNAYFEELMARHGRRKGEAALAAGIDRRTLQRYLNRLGVTDSGEPESGAEASASSVEEASATAESHTSPSRASAS